LAASHEDGGEIERYGLKIMSAGFILADDQPMLLSA
jgi:hypothetical protein